jgi:hypothetical protein
MLNISLSRIVSIIVDLSSTTLSQNKGKTVELFSDRMHLSGGFDLSHTAYVI